MAASWNLTILIGTDSESNASPTSNEDGNGMPLAFSGSGFPLVYDPTLVVEERAENGLRTAQEWINERPGGH